MIRRPPRSTLFPYTDALPISSRLTLTLGTKGGAFTHQVLAFRTLWMPLRSEEHTSELQSQSNLVCRLLLEKKKNKTLSVEPFCVASSVSPYTYIQVSMLNAHT